MHIINITDEHKKYATAQAPRQTIGGRSNLSKSDLEKATRQDFQFTGIYGELGWYLYRYGGFDKLAELNDLKFEVCRKNGVGDNGIDDILTHNNKTRYIDIKSSHVTELSKIERLNLVIPPGEFHKNMIYICAFTVGPTRQQIDKVVLAGWCINEDVHKKWNFDPAKYCVPVSELRKLETLKIYF